MNTVNTLTLLIGKNKSIYLHNVGIEYDTVYHSIGYCQSQDGQEDNKSYSSSSKREEQSYVGIGTDMTSGTTKHETACGL